jgi:myo-inositol 2-dehydrogenase / D-chiro-inositol 1-dehydrogenase
VRFGVIGVGRMGVVHAATLASHRDVDSVALCDADAARAQEVGAELGIDVVPSVDALLSSVDAVVIAAATSAHAELIHAAADANVPAFCEKPISLDLKSTVEVMEHVDEAGISLQMGFQRRFDHGYRAARDLVADGSIGDLYVVRMSGHDPAPPPEDYIRVSGGIYVDFSVHDFDALRFVTDQEVEEVYADGTVVAFPVFERYRDVDSAVVTLKLSGGSLGILSVTRHDALGYDVRMELIGSGDCVAVGWDDRMPLRSVEPGAKPAPDDAYRNFQDRFDAAYKAEMSAFVEVAAGRRASPCTARDALEALKVALACDLSRSEHRPVSIEEIA